MVRPNLLIATRNPGKMREYRHLLQDIPFELVSLEDIGVSEEVEETGRTFAENASLKARTYSALGGLLTLADDSGLEVVALGGEPGVHSARYGEKFLEPSYDTSLKPVAQKSPQPPFNKGGQSGILGAGSGVLSDQDRVRLLLRNLGGVPWSLRTARFRCVIAIATPSNSPLVNEGRGNLLPSRNQPVDEQYQQGGVDINLVEGSVAGMIQYEPMGEEGFGYDPVFYLPSYGLTMAQLPLEEKNRISHRANAAGKALKLLSTASTIRHGAHRDH